MQDKNVVIVSEREYNELMKAKRNAEYLAKIDESMENQRKGDTISFTLEELREMEDEDWKPSERILEFEKKHGIQRLYPARVIMKIKAWEVLDCDF